MAEQIHDEKPEVQHLKKGFVPTSTEVATLIIGSLLLLISLNILPAIKSSSTVNYSSFVDYIREHIERLLAPTNNQQASVILTMLFWMVLGMFAYVFLWIIMSTFANYRKDVMETKGMVLPQEFDKDAAWHEAVLKIVIRVLATLMFLYWIYLILASILPYATTLFLNSITELTLRSVATLALSVIILASSVFVAMIFARCIVLRERVFGS